jgi:hypothetical protein
MNTYFATTEQEQLYLSKFSSTSSNCACGQTEAVYIDEKKDEKIIICDACYENASYKERYF